MTSKDIKALAVVIPALLLAFVLTPDASLATGSITHMNVLGSEFTTQVATFIGGIFLLLGAGRVIIDNVIE